MADVHRVQAALQNLADDVIPNGDPYTLVQARAVHTRRLRRARAGSLAVGLAALVAVTGTGIAQLDRPHRNVPGAPTAATPACATTRTLAAPTPGGTPIPANQQRLNDLALQIEADAGARFPHSYTGVEIDTAADLVRVYRVPDPSLDRWLFDTYPSTCVVLIDTAHARAELLALQQRIIADREFWKSQGVTVYGLMITLSGTLEVGTLDVDKAKQLFPDRYGSDTPIVIVRRGPDIPYGATANGSPGPQQTR
ncbi:hypothetical protein [Dactylosporangium sp. CA-139066]|uniref:hypothetical protein n=1 Tax=Dactylosporangium sp. CA-139066 TaxID=3239930 RepID=UPI003D92AC69